MIKFKSIISDLDGTLIHNNHIVEKNLADFVKQWQASGHSFSIATGRAYVPTVQKVIKQLNLTSPQIINGGAQIIDPSRNRIIKSIKINTKISKRIIEYLLKIKNEFVVIDNNRVYSSSNLKSIDIKEIEYENINKAKLSNVVKIRVILRNNLTLKEENDIKSKLKKIDPTLTIWKNTSNSIKSFDVTGNKADKYNAVLKLQRMFGINTEEMIAIGDDENDYPLLLSCGYRIAFSDSPKLLKKIANSVVNRNSDNLAELLRNLTYS